MLAADPEANVLNFTLGNQLAQQGRWAEAQQELAESRRENEKDEEQEELAGGVK